MKVYFACSITGGRNDEGIYQAIVETLLDEGHETPTAHLASPEVMALEHVIEPEEVYTRDIEWINDCDALVAEVSTPSHGVGYEISYALNLGKPVLCCYRKGVKVSKMITGNTMPGLELKVNTSRDEVKEMVSIYLQALAEQSG